MNDSLQTISTKNWFEKHKKLKQIIRPLKYGHFQHTDTQLWLFDIHIISGEVWLRLITLAQSVGHAGINQACMQKLKEFADIEILVILPKGHDQFD